MGVSISNGRRWGVWIPACAGMTEGGAGTTGVSADVADPLAAGKGGGGE